MGICKKDCPMLVKGWRCRTGRYYLCNAFKLRQADTSCSLNYNVFKRTGECKVPVTLKINEDGNPIKFKDCKR